jgi:hypothetical protein
MELRAVFSVRFPALARLRPVSAAAMRDNGRGRNEIDKTIGIGGRRF